MLPYASVQSLHAFGDRIHFSISRLKVMGGLWKHAAPQAAFASPRAGYWVRCTSKDLAASCRRGRDNLPKQLSHDFTDREEFRGVCKPLQTWPWIFLLWLKRWTGDRGKTLQLNTVATKEAWSSLCIHKRWWLICDMHIFSISSLLFEFIYYLMLPNVSTGHYTQRTTRKEMIKKID